MLSGPEDLARITGAVPAAGATALGNLGQYFTFRLPGWGNDVATTETKVTAPGLIAGRGGRVHSNLDDGFAGLFRDLARSSGMVIVEKHIVEQPEPETLRYNLPQMSRGC